MKIIDSDYKVITVKCFIALVAISIVAFTAFNYLIEEFFPSPVKVRLVARGIFWLLLTFYFCRFSYKAIDTKQFPPKGVWVIETWKVYQGKQAYILGWVVMTASLGIGIITFTSIFLNWQVLSLSN